MKTIFDQATRDEVINRITSLSSTSTAQWGKMNVEQMARHCTIWDEWVQGTNNPPYYQSFLGRIFGKMALKSAVNPDKPLQKGMPAGNLVVKKSDAYLEVLKHHWIARVQEYAQFSNPRFIHDFFGKMTDEQIGIFAYKHVDHHLRQFNA